MGCRCLKWRLTPLHHNSCPRSCTFLYIISVVYLINLQFRMKVLKVEATRIGFLRENIQEEWEVGRP